MSYSTCIRAASMSARDDATMSCSIGAIATGLRRERRAAPTGCRRTRESARPSPSAGALRCARDRRTCGSARRRRTTPSARLSPAERMTASGVRSSCETAATNSICWRASSCARRVERISRPFPRVHARAQPRRALPLRRPAGGRDLGTRSPPSSSPWPACSPSTGSSCRRCTRSRWPTARTGSRSPSTSGVAVVVASSRRGRAGAPRRPSSASARRRCSPSVATRLLSGGDVAAQIDAIAPSAAAEVLGVARRAARARTAPDPPRGESPLELETGRPLGRHALRARARRRRTWPCAARFLPALASLLAVAIDRERLAREALEAEALRESDAIKTAVLRAVSHDLRSPLTAMRVRRRQPRRQDPRSRSPPTRRPPRRRLGIEMRPPRAPRRRPPRPLPARGRRRAAAARASGPSTTSWPARSTSRRRCAERVTVDRCRPTTRAGRRRRGPDPAGARQPARERAALLARRRR